MGPDAEGFDTLLIKFRKDVLAHAEREEREEFPLLRTAHDPKRLEAMAGTVRAAEAVAPTRPHPGLQGATANVLLGPPVAIMDRARDAIRKTPVWWPKPVFGVLPRCPAPRAMVM
jgi:hypothetical protein